MHASMRSSKDAGRTTSWFAGRLFRTVAPVVLIVAAMGAGCRSSAPAAEPEVPVPAAGVAGVSESSAPPPGAGAGATAAVELAEKWGVEVVGLRRSAAGYMLDFRYKVLDPEKAAPLFVRANKPVAVHHATGARMQIHSPAKTGPLRPTNPPQAGRTYFMFFANAQGIVQAGDLVTVEIGLFAADVVVE